MDYPSPNIVALTDSGRAAVSTSDDSRSVRERLGPILSGPEARILDALPHDGEAMSNDELATAAGYSASSTGYTNPRGALRTLGLVTYPQPGFVAVETWVWS